MTSTSPTARTMAECRKRGWILGVVEQTIPKTHLKRDFLGIIDILVLDGQPGSLGIQATSANNHAARRTKALDRDHRLNLRRWLEAGNRFAIWSWGFKGPRGSKKAWTLREEELHLHDLRSTTGEA